MNQGKFPYLDFHSVIGTTILSRRRPIASSLMTTAVRIFLISSPSAGSNRIRQTSPLTGFGFVTIEFFLTKGVESGEFRASAVVLLRHCRRRGQKRLPLLA